MIETYVTNENHQFLAVIQSGLILGACSDGFGKTMKLVPEGLQDKVQKVGNVNLRGRRVQSLFG